MLLWSGSTSLFSVRNILFCPYKIYLTQLMHFIWMW